MLVKSLDVGLRRAERVVRNSEFSLVVKVESILRITVSIITRAKAQTCKLCLLWVVITHFVVSLELSVIIAE